MRGGEWEPNEAAAQTCKVGQDWVCVWRGGPWVSLGPAWEVASCSSQRDHMVSSEKYISLSSRECGGRGDFWKRTVPLCPPLPVCLPPGPDSRTQPPISAWSEVIPSLPSTLQALLHSPSSGAPHQGLGHAKYILSYCATHQAVKEPVKNCFEWVRVWKEKGPHSSWQAGCLTSRM